MAIKYEPENSVHYYYLSELKKDILDSSLKNKIKNTSNINLFLQKSKKDLEKLFNIKIEYLENRNTKNLTISNKYKGSKIFLSYYYKNIRLIDNF